MGIEPFLIASTVNTVIGQRLVRRITTDKTPVEANDRQQKLLNDELKDLLPGSDKERQAAMEDLGYDDLPLSTDNAYTLYEGKEDKLSPGGYKGRVGIYEVFSVTETLEKLITERATSTVIQNAAIEEGLITMRQDGYFKALSGLTSIDEVNRVTAADA